MPGEPWHEALEEALDASHICAVFLGPVSLGTWQNEEMRAAIQTHVEDEPSYLIIPARLPGTTGPG